MAQVLIYRLTNPSSVVKSYTTTGIFTETTIETQAALFSGATETEAIAAAQVVINTNSNPSLWGSRKPH